MRTMVIVVLAAAVGIALGVGTTWARLGHAPDAAADYDLLLAKIPEPTQPKQVSGPQPRVVVDADEHDFGTIERYRSESHAFRFSNEGQAALVLTSGGTSCGKCTISTLPPSAIKPGETAAVVVEYNASVDSPHFRQTATILTNDPLNPRVVLTVTGKVSSSYEVTPRELVFSKLAANESRTGKLRIVSFLSDSFTLDSPKLTDPDTARYFDVQITPIPSDELTEPDAKCGYTVTVEIKPGLPLGSLRQSVELSTSLPNTPTLVIPIEGSVGSDITLVGSGYDSDAGAVALGVVRSSAGVKRKLHVLVRGEHRHDVNITPGKRDPELLRVELGDPTDVNGGAVVRIPLTIEIPPGTPACNHLGTPGKMGQITLETSHPDAKQVRLYVQFAVED